MLHLIDDKNEWLLKAYKLKNQKKLDACCESLLYYYENVSYIHPLTKKINSLGHAGIFSDVYNGGYLYDFISNLKKVLPKNFYDNFMNAYNKWISISEYAETEEIVDALEEYDDYADETNEIAEILKNYIERFN